MKTSKIKILCSLTGFLFLVACGGGAGSGSPSDPANLDGDAAPVSFGMTASASAPSALIVTDGGGTTVDVTGAWINAAEVEIELPEGLGCAVVDFELPSFAACAEETEMEEGVEEVEAEIRLTGPFIFDLLAGTSTPEIGAFSVPSGLIHEIEVEVDDVEEETALPAGVPAELSGNTLIAVGTLTLSGTPTPFSLRLKFSEEMEFEDLSGLELSETAALNQILVNFNIASWLSGVDLAACIAEGDVTTVDGTIVIDENSNSGDCSDIENTIKDNIEASGLLDEEDDSDDEDEDDAEDGEDEDAGDEDEEADED